MAAIYTKRISTNSSTGVVISKPTALWIWVIKTIKWASLIYPFLWAKLCLPKLVLKALSPVLQNVVWRQRTLNRWLWLYEVIKVAPIQYEWCSYKRRLVQTHIGKTMWRKRENTCKSMADSCQCMAKTTTIL